MHTNLGELHTISEKDAARLLATESTVGSLDLNSALRVVRYMKPKRIKAGAALIREGEKSGNDFFMLILSGDVRVESRAQGLAEPVVITVLGAGDLIGEFGLINDTPRSATCIASTELAVAVMTRTSMNKLLKEDSEVAARFLLALSSRLANRLIETTNKLKLFVQLNAVLQHEVYLLMDAQEPKTQPMPRSELPTEPMGLATQPADLTDAFVAERMAQSKARNQRPF
ncbi:MAG: cyclic nucleotide-binding domain-containing protein [Brachymonas sp.]